MELNQEEQRDGMRWLFATGAIAILFSIFLVVVDERLSHSPREKILGNTLRELRTAQADVHSVVVDERATGNYIPVPPREVRGAEAQKAEGAPAKAE